MRVIKRWGEESADLQLRIPSVSITKINKEQQPNRYIYITDSRDTDPALLQNFSLFDRREAKINMKKYFSSVEVTARVTALSHI